MTRSGKRGKVKKAAKPVAGKQMKGDARKKRNAKLKAALKKMKIKVMAERRINRKVEWCYRIDSGESVIDAVRSFKNAYGVLPTRLTVAKDTLSTYVYLWHHTADMDELHNAYQRQRQGQKAKNSAN